MVILLLRGEWSWWHQEVGLKDMFNEILVFILTRTQMNLRKIWKKFQLGNMFR